MEQEEHINKLQELQQVLTENSDKLEKADIEKEDDKLVEVSALACKPSLFRGIARGSY